MPVLLFIDNTARHFLTHRTLLARAARSAGYQVHVALPETDDLTEVSRLGFPIHPYALTRKGTNPFVEIRSIKSLRRVLDFVRPDLVHNLTLKPVIYGTLAAMGSAHISVVNAVTGLGYLFTDGSAFARLLQTGFRVLGRIPFRHPKVWFIFQNHHDQKTFQESGLISGERSIVIGGSGVEVPPLVGPQVPRVPAVLLAARMLWQKGVGDYVAAAKRLKEEKIEARFLLAGDSDPGNPSSIPVEQLESWHKGGHVEWLGWRKDMGSLLNEVDIACLPTGYGEGIPRSLLEAAAHGKPIVTTDIPGCRDLVVDRESGFLIRPGDQGALVDSLRVLLRDPSLRASMGAKSRERVIDRFSDVKVNQLTLGVYQSAMRRPG